MKENMPIFIIKFINGEIIYLDATKPDHYSNYKRIDLYTIEKISILIGEMVYSLKLPLSDDKPLYRIFFIGSVTFNSLHLPSKLEGMGIYAIQDGKKYSLNCYLDSHCIKSNIEVLQLKHSKNFGKV